MALSLASAKNQAQAPPPRSKPQTSSKNMADALSASALTKATAATHSANICTHAHLSFLRESLVACRDKPPAPAARALGCKLSLRTARQ